MITLFDKLVTFGKAYIFFMIMLCIIVPIWCLHSHANLIDSDNDLTLKRVETRYTDDFIFSEQYWKERNEWYTIYCTVDDTVNSRICAESVDLSHRRYINDRYASVYDRIEWIENGRPFSIKRLFWAF